MLKTLLPIAGLICLVGCQNTSPEFYGILAQAEYAPDPKLRIQAIQDLVQHHWDEKATSQTLVRIFMKDQDPSVKASAHMGLIAIKALKGKSDDDTTTAILLMG